MTSERPSRVPEFGRPDAQEFSIGKKVHKVADIEPLDVTGVRTMLVGTVAWAVAAIIMLPFWSTLRDTDRTWWMWTALAGFGLGLLGFEYCRNRAASLKSGEKERGPVQGTSRRSSLFSRRSVTKRLQSETRDEAQALETEVPSRESLGRKQSLLGQVLAPSDSTSTAADNSSSESPADNLDREDQEIQSDPETEITPPRPVGRRRKPGPVDG